MNITSTDIDIGRLIRDGHLRTFLQPIVSVRQKAVAGVESLLRAQDPVTGELIPPNLLFAAADAGGCRRALDRAARNNALRLFADRALGDQCLLFMNIDIDTILTGDGVDEFLHLVRALDLPAGSIVAELIEKPFEDHRRLERFVTRVREHGILVAIDDMGAGHSNLERIGLIRPDVMKIDRSLCAKLGSDATSKDVFRSLVQLGERIGALVVAEGIETDAQAMSALECGAELLQGYLVLPPQPGGLLDLEQADKATRVLAGRFRQHMLDTINRSKLERRRQNMLLDGFLCELNRAEPARFAGTLARCVRGHDTAECAYVLDHLGRQMTETVFADGPPPPSLLFKPADVGCDHSLKTYYHRLLDSDQNRFVTERYTSLASGRPCRTISSAFRDASNERTFILCVDVTAA